MDEKCQWEGCESDSDYEVETKINMEDGTVLTKTRHLCGKHLRELLRMRRKEAPND